jgi:hypothetical protein
MTQTLIDEPLRHVTEEAWNLSKERERETDTHPCDHWHAPKCMCKGACSCHWKHCPRCKRLAGPPPTDLCYNCQDALVMKFERFARAQGLNITEPPQQFASLLVELRKIDPSACIAIPTHDEITIICAAKHKTACAEVVRAWLEQHGMDFTLERA